jgi:hypothetical protein
MAFERTLRPKLRFHVFRTNLFHEAFGVDMGNGYVGQWMTREEFCFMAKADKIK